MGRSLLDSGDRQHISVLHLSAFAGIYFVSVLGGEALYGSLAVPSPFWFPDSILLCALLLNRKEQWWIWIVATWPIRLAIGGPLGTPFWFVLFGIANDSLKGFAAAWWLRRVVPHRAQLTSLRELTVFFAIAALALPLLSALAAAPARHALGDSWWRAGYGWFLGDAVAQVVVTPALLFWATGRDRRVTERWQEAMLLTVGLVAALYFAFVVRSPWSSPIGLYAPVPFLIWAAVRLQPFGAANAMCLVAFVSMLGAVNGTGVFSDTSAGQSVLSIQLFLLFVSPSLLCLSMLVSERETRERALRESESRFRLVADTAPMLIWMSGPDKLCAFVSKTWTDFTGRSLSDELGDGWSSDVHPDDLSRCLETYSSAFDAREPFDLEYRMRRHDGEFRWIVNRAVPRFEPAGAFVGYIGSCIDITERKLAEQQLQALSGRLISAQERERARIARELHDDLCQRMALLQISIEQFALNTAELSSSATGQLRQIVEATARISSGLHHLAHRVYPSTLAPLGLVGAVKGLCREFSEQHGLRVSLIHHDMPDQLSDDVSQCLFRVVQEALQNVVKHSGVAEATVELSGKNQRVDLCVSDHGAGFDPHAARAKPGLGLARMQERLRPIGGDLWIHSAPASGTHIRASMPSNR